MTRLDRWRIGELDDAAYRAGTGPGREIWAGIAPGRETLRVPLSERAQ